MRENENFYERCHSFREIRQFFAKVFREKFSRKPQSDEKWYEISVEKEYMEPDPWFFYQVPNELTNAATVLTQDSFSTQFAHC
jgi:hypothetical protein